MGTDIEVPTVDGKARIKIKAGTQSGEVLRLRGKGIPNLNGYGVGDQLVHVSLYTPTSLSSEEKATLQSLRNSSNFSPKPNSDGRSFMDRMKDLFQ